MRPFALVVPALFLGTGLVGCVYVPADSDGGSDSGLEDTGLPSSTDETDPARPPHHRDDTTPSTPGATTTPDPAGWALSAHPCFGNRTDTLLVEGHTAWVGCGSTTEGKGLFRSDDDGASWYAVYDSFFSQFRVSSITRSADGLLYVAGIDTVSAERVVSLDDQGNVAEVFAAGNQVWNSFHVGTFLRNSQGLAVAESLTGTELVTRDSDAADWQDNGRWWGGAGSYQVLDLVLHDDAFYGVGSTITQPPYVYLPPAGGQQPGRFGFGILELSVGPIPFDGELWGIAVDGAGQIAVAGVDEDHHVGYLFWSGPDPMADWDDLDVSSMMGDEPVAMRGTCRDGDTIVGVGEYSQRGTGIVVRSDDGGATWTDLTPVAELPPGAAFPPVQKCAFRDDGALVVTGAEGMYATFTN